MDHRCPRRQCLITAGVNYTSNKAVGQIYVCLHLEIKFLETITLEVNAILQPIESKQYMEKLYNLSHLSLVLLTPVVNLYRIIFTKI